MNLSDFARVGDNDTAMSELLLGIDIGTTNVKAVLATPEGWIIAEAKTNYPIYHPKPGWAEQEAADWYISAIPCNLAINCKRAS